MTGGEAAPAIEARGLTKRYPNGAVALDDFSVRIETSEMVMVTGPSGSGKTTFFRLGNGSVRATSGELAVLGTPMRHARGGALRSLRRRVAVVFQNHNLVPSLSVLQNVLIGSLGAQSLPGILRRSFFTTAAERRAVYELLDELRIADKLYTRVEDLSGGQQQRVAVARALLQGPALLLADEPVASVDGTTAHVILEMLERRCHERGVTVLVSLHQREYLQRYGDREIELWAGKVVSDSASIRSLEVAR